jgi:hypothetical protein
MYRTASVLLAASSIAAFAQTGSNPVSLPAQATLPIVFTQTVSARQAHAGDSVIARTIQSVRLANGAVIPSGAHVTGHVVAAAAFAFDPTPYAKQKDSVLTIHFDTVETRRGTSIPIHATVRALADVFATNAAYEPPPSDLDPLGTRKLVGGELLTPSQKEVRNLDGDTVAYNRADGVYAHLIPRGRCDGSSVEVSMGIFSASACGLYGYADVSATEFGSPDAPSTLTLVSHRTSPAIWKHSTALLEVLPEKQASAGL